MTKRYIGDDHGQGQSMVRDGVVPKIPPHVYPDWFYQIVVYVGFSAAAGSILTVEFVPLLGDLLLAVAMVCTAYLLLCALWAYENLLIAWAVMNIVLVSTTATLDLLEGPQQWGILVRYLVSLNCFGLALAGRESIGSRLMPVVAAALILFSAGYTARHGLEMEGGYPRFSAFFGASASLHSTALVVCASMVIVWFSNWKRFYRLLWTTIGFVMLIGYSVMTVLLVIVGILAADALRRGRKSYWWLSIPASISLVLVIAVRDLTAVAGGIEAEGIGAVGSGRLGSWIERAVTFWERPLLFKMIGAGPRSDFRPTELWWWEPKVAHSELLTVLMEFGIYGLLAVIIFFGVLIRWGNAGQRIVLIAFLAGMCMSNVILERPTAALFWGFAVMSISQSALEPGHRQVGSRFTVSDVST